MHPLGSIDILVAAGGGFHCSFAFVFFPSIFHCLSIIPTFNTTTSILKHFIRSNILSVLLAFTCQTWVIFNHGYLSQYLPNRLKSLPVPVRGPACSQELRDTKNGDGQHPKRLTCHRFAPSEQAHVCFRQRAREGARERERERAIRQYHIKIHVHTHECTSAHMQPPVLQKPGDSPYLKQALKIDILSLATLTQ